MIGTLALALLLAAQEKPAKALTPGEILLLSNSADPATADDPLSRALSSPDPAVRMSAARVIAVVPHGALRGALIGALAREQNAATAAEMIRDLLMLSETADLGLIDVELKRFGASAAIPFAEWLARIRPREFTSKLSDLTRASGERARELSKTVALAAAQHLSDAFRISTALPCRP